MFKVNYNDNDENFSFKIYEDKFTDNSILRMEIIIQDENQFKHKNEFKTIMEKIKEIIDNQDKALNTNKLLLKILNAEEIVLSKNDHLSPIQLFPKFPLVREMEDGRKEYEGNKYITWETFKEFSNNLIN